MGLAELLRTVQELGTEVKINIEGREAARVSVEGSNVNVDILDPALVAKIVAGLK